MIFVVSIEKDQSRPAGRTAEGAFTQSARWPISPRASAKSAVVTRALTSASPGLYVSSLLGIPGR
nr:hypothetical protein [Streptomyces sp. 8L]